MTYLGEKGKSDTICFFCKLLDGSFISWLLLTELVAGETQYDQSLRLVLLVESLEVSVLPHGTSVCSGVED